MTDTTVLTGSASTAKRWARKWWMAAKHESFFYSRGLVGPEEETNYVIVEKSDLEKDKGDKITFGQWQHLSGSGISGDSTLEGSEEEMSDYTDDVTINQIRNAVRPNGRVTEQRHAAKQNTMRQVAKNLLKVWMADYIDSKLFTDLSTSPTKAIYGGDATATTDIESGDYFDLNLITKAETLAGKSTPLIKPVAMKGDRMFVCVMSLDQAYDLKEQSSRWEQAQREAQGRGNKNPLFSGALGMWDNTVLHKHQNVATSAVWGGSSNLAGATALFLGVGAGAIAYAKKKTWNEKTFDYGNKTGYAVGSIFGSTKVVFNSNDHAVIGILTYRSNIS
jgi:N4-gp56 family major capsid protein